MAKGLWLASFCFWCVREGRLSRIYFLNSSSTWSWVKYFIVLLGWNSQWRNARRKDLNLPFFYQWKTKCVCSKGPCPSCVVCFPWHHISRRSRLEPGASRYGFPASLTTSHWQDWVNFSQQRKDSPGFERQAASLSHSTVELPLLQHNQAAGKQDQPRPHWWKLKKHLIPIPRLRQGFKRHTRKGVHGTWLNCECKANNQVLNQELLVGGSGCYPFQQRVRGRVSFSIYWRSIPQSTIIWFPI